VIASSLESGWEVLAPSPGVKMGQPALNIGARHQKVTSSQGTRRVGISELGKV